MLALRQVVAGRDVGCQHEAEHQLRDPGADRIVALGDAHRCEFDDRPTPNQHPVPIFFVGARLRFVIGAGETVRDSPSWVAPGNRASVFSRKSPWGLTHGSNPTEIDRHRGWHRRRTSG